MPGGKACMEVSILSPRRVRLRGIMVHQVGSLAAVDVTVVRAIPVTTAARTIIDLAAVVSDETLEEALDDALRRGLTTPARLLWRIEDIGARGRSGIGVLRLLIEERKRYGIRSESGLETKLFRELRRAGVPLPVSQYEIPVGRRRLRLDFAYPDLRLAIEVDGYRWHSSRRRWEGDLERGNLLMRSGWAVLRFTSRDIQDRANEVCVMTAEALWDRIEISRSSHRT